MIFILVSLIFYPGLALTVARGFSSGVMSEAEDQVISRSIGDKEPAAIRTRMLIVRAN